MPVERISVIGADGKVDRPRWLELRKQDVTASTVGALFGMHPYTSALALYHEKCGLELPDQSNVRMRRGLRLERAVAEEVADRRPDWTIKPAAEYLRDPELRLGATPDFYIEGDPRGPGVLQTKVSTLRAFKAGWRQTDAIVPPFWIGLQTLTEAMLHGASWGAAAVYIDDPWNDDCYICEIERHAGAEARIRDAVAAFWQSVEWGEEPAPDYARDADLIASLYPEAVPLKSIDLTGDNHLPVILAERGDLKARINADQARVEEIDTEIKSKMGDAEIAIVDGYALTFKTQSRKAYSVKATTFRRLNVTATREKEADNAGPF